MVITLERDGSILYAHLAWSDDPTGENLQLEEYENASYSGHYIDSDPEESLDRERYEWEENLTIDEEDTEEIGDEEDIPEDEEEDEFDEMEEDVDLEDEEEDESLELESVVEEIEDNVMEISAQNESVENNLEGTQQTADLGIGNVNELHNTNQGVTGWSVPEGFTVETVKETFTGEPDSELLTITRIQRIAEGIDVIATFEASALAEKLGGMAQGNGYTFSAMIKTSELFSIKDIGIRDIAGDNEQLHFGNLDNTIIISEENEESPDEAIMDEEDGEEGRDIEELPIDAFGGDDEDEEEIVEEGKVIGKDTWISHEIVAENTECNYSAQRLCFDLESMPIGAILDVCDLKIEAGAMATPWRESVEEIDTKAEMAQQTATKAEEIATATNQHFWTDDAGVHISNEVTAEGNGKPDGEKNSLWNSLGMLFRKGINNLVAILSGDTPGSRGLAIYDGEGNEEGNIIAKFTGNGASIRNKKCSMTIDKSSIKGVVSDEQILDVGVNVNDLGLTEMTDIDPWFKIESGSAAYYPNGISNITPHSFKLYEIIYHSYTVTVDNTVWKLHDPQYEAGVNAYMQDIGATTYEYISVSKEVIPHIISVSIPSGTGAVTDGGCYPLDNDDLGVDVLNDHVFVIYDEDEWLALTAFNANGHQVSYESGVEEESTLQLADITKDSKVVGVKLPTVHNKDELDTHTLSRLTYTTPDNPKYFTFGSRNSYYNLGNNSLCVGANNAAIGTHSTCIGKDNTAFASHSVAIGRDNQTEVSGSTLIGTGLTTSFHAEGASFQNAKGCFVTGTFNDPEPNAMFQVGAGKGMGDQRNILNLSNKGYLTLADHNSWVGQTEYKSKNVQITSSNTGMDKKVVGVSKTLGAGVWVITAYAGFNTGTGSGTRGVDISLRLSNDVLRRTRVYNVNQNWSELNLTYIANISKPTTYYVCKSATTAEKEAEFTVLHAVRIF